MFVFFAPGKIRLPYFFTLLALFDSGCAPQIPEISGTAYYIDCAKGSDANYGTSARQAWGSVGRVNQTVFKPGDGIFFKREVTCQGSLTPQGSGKNGQPIIIGAYDSGEFPRTDSSINSIIHRISHAAKYRL